MDTAIIVAFVAVGITCVSSIIDAIQTMHIRKVQNQLAEATSLWKGKGDLGDQLGEYLMERESEDKPTNMEVLGSVLGSSMVKSMNATTAGVKSGDVRLQKSVDNQVFEAVKGSDPNLALISSVLDKLGLGELATPELLPYAARAIQKFGLHDGGSLPSRSSNRNSFGIE